MRQQLRHHAIACLRVCARARFRVPNHPFRSILFLLNLIDLLLQFRYLFCVTHNISVVRVFLFVFARQRGPIALHAALDVLLVGVAVARLSRGSDHRLLSRAVAGSKPPDVEIGHPLGVLRFVEDVKKSEASTPRWDVILKVNKEIWLPNLLGALTTCIGFLTLLWVDVPLIRSYGVEVASAVMISWLATSFGILPLLMLFPHPVPRRWVTRKVKWPLWIVQRAKPIAAFIVTLCVVLIMTAHHLYWTARLFNDIPKGEPARVSTEKIAQSVGGVIPLDIAVKSNVKSAWSDPAKLKKLKALLAKLRDTNGVGAALSVPNFFYELAEISKPILPISRAAVSEIYFLYSMSDHDPLDRYLSSNKRIVRIALRIRDLPSNAAKALVQKLKRQVQNYFPHDRVGTGGTGATVHVIQDYISSELIGGFWQALLIIAITLVIIFRSIRTMLIAMLPNLMPPIFLLGYLSLTHTPIKPGVAVIFSIALGLAFNNTVYLLNRLRAFKESKGIVRSSQVTQAFCLESKPCLISTAIFLIGFSVFLFSYFSLNRTFGLCMIVSLTGGAIGDLIFLPAVLACRKKIIL